MHVGPNICAYMLCICQCLQCLLTNTDFAGVGSAARVQRLPGQFVAALNNWTKGPCLAWNSGVNNTRRICRHTLPLSHDYVIGPPALPRLNIAKLFNSCA